MRVWNNNGPSDQSATILCSTAPSGMLILFVLFVSFFYLCEKVIKYAAFFTVPISVPKVKVNIISSTKLNVSWEPLTKKESRGIVIQYKLLLRRHEQPSSRALHFRANVESYILSGMNFLF